MKFSNQVDTLIQKYVFTREEVLNDYRLACESRHVSLIGRKEVFMGKAKFGIFGDGKEIAQIAMAKAFQKGDWRSGYYRDQTFMFAIGELSIEQYFAQLYAHTDLDADPSSAGRCMNGHFATRSRQADGSWNNLMEIHNSSSDISSTAAQMPRLLGLAYASKLFRNNPDLGQYKHFSNNGNEIAFGTIGNAATSEGHFYEVMNAAGVLQVPMLMSVWDDGYGISVSQEYHTVKMSISEALQGMQRNENQQGIEIFRVAGWDYLALCENYLEAAKLCREQHVPVLFHVDQMTQPQGHSTSGSHERYKSKERLEWEENYDCIKKMGEWILQNGYANTEELEEIDQKAQKTANDAKNRAWKAYLADMDTDFQEALLLIDNLAHRHSNIKQLASSKNELANTLNPLRLDTIKAVKKVLRIVRNENSSEKTILQNWLKRVMDNNHDRYSSFLYIESDKNVPVIAANYSDNSPMLDGRQILQACFDAAFERDKRIFAIGEDVGKIGDVNQAFAGLQAKFGEIRITDTGIRELSIIGQGIGAALRGLRPITEIQYLDYLIFGFEPMVDDISCTLYRTKGGQRVPMIIRTRGHRLEGIFHSGSPMSMIINGIRGMYLLVPRNMTQAAGMYNTLLLCDEPAILVESLNGYRLKERLPDNIGEFTVPLGISEIIREGNDITIVTYGSMCRIVLEAAKLLQEFGIDCEVLDVQTLLPFDRNEGILASVKKTNRVIFADEDVPNGATAYMLSKALEQGIFQYLDYPPVCLAAKEHRPAYGSDGDYFSKPNVEDIFDAVYEIMSESNPKSFPDLYK